MQFHQGSKLKKIVEKSGLTISQIVETSGVSKGTLYNFFDYEEITRKKLTPVLEALNYDVDQFYSSKNIVMEGSAGYGLQLQIEAMKKKLTC